MHRFTHQSPLGRARGLGSARSGVGHFLWERLTGLALVPLGIWFVYALISTLMNGDIGTLGGWLHSPVVLVLMLLLVGLTFIHSMVGTQVVIEDYVHRQPWSGLLLLVNKSLHILLGLCTLVAVLKLHMNPLILPN